MPPSSPTRPPPISPSRRCRRRQRQHPRRLIGCAQRCGQECRVALVCRGLCARNAGGFRMSWIRELRGMLGLWRGAPDLRGAGEGEDCAAEGRAHSDGAQRRRELYDGRFVLRCGRGDFGYGATRVPLAVVDGDGGHRCAAGGRAQSDGAQRRRKLHCRRFLAKGSTGRQPGLRTAGGGDTTARPKAAHGGGGAQRRRARHCLRPRRLRRRPDPGKEQAYIVVRGARFPLLKVPIRFASSTPPYPCLVLRRR
ncbi:hypothetical protein BD626DRAFT_160104 [Schizophyllum amplum]|uniref:Uncharacterized protein n=1 Tax=Schizophyllum amplum TaxID=97359 RepID=A0A550CP30_9AGAR|nr:hypothetical protein BD626DRAFT_160104 [Auriculariopsis ampla]